jgi:predicted transcriptional regulator
LVVDGWDSKEGQWSPDESSLAMRACKMREWLKEREEEEIIVITHGGIQPIPAARFILAFFKKADG